MFIGYLSEEEIVINVFLLWLYHSSDKIILKQYISSLKPYNCCSSDKVL